MKVHVHHHHGIHLPHYSTLQHQQADFTHRNHNTRIACAQLSHYSTTWDLQPKLLEGFWILQKVGIHEYDCALAHLKF